MEFLLLTVVFILRYLVWDHHEWHVFVIIQKTNKIRHNFKSLFLNYTKHL